MTAQLRLRVERIACDGRGRCAEVLPELIVLDDWGYPILRTDAVPDHLARAANRRSSSCAPCSPCTWRRARSDVRHGPASNHVELSIGTIRLPCELAERRDLLWLTEERHGRRGTS
jgi:ferredoxin